MQEVRDACADFARGDTDEADDDQNADEVDEQAAVSLKDVHTFYPSWKLRRDEKERLSQCLTGQVYSRATAISRDPSPGLWIEETMLHLVQDVY